MSIYKTCGIILKRSNFGEADRLLTIFTEGKGKIKVIAKGVRKQNSRLGGHLELFCLTNLVIAEGRNLDIVTEAEIIESYINVRNNLEKANATYYLAEIVDKLTAEYESHDDVFNLLKITIDRINENKKNLSLPYFEINLLKSIGYEPELGKCLKCQKAPEPKDNSFDLAEGGLVCGNCGGFAEKISDEAVKILRLFLSAEISILDRLKLGASLVEEIESTTKNYIRYIHQDEFKSSRFLKDWKL